MVRHGLLALCGAVAILVSLALADQPASVRADATVSPCNVVTLQQALSVGGLVTFSCGGPATIQITQTLIVTTSVTLDGGDSVTLDGQGLRRIMRVQPGAVMTLTRITLRNGYADDGQGGGAVHVEPGATFQPVSATFSNNRALLNPTPDGGAIWSAAGSTVVISGSTFLSNTAGYGGGAILAQDSVAISGSVFVSNTASAGEGGAILGRVSLFITGSTIVSNTARTSGGGVYADSSASIASSTFMSNTAGSLGGGVIALTATITGSTIVSNTSGLAGGGVFAGTTASIAGTTIGSNSATTGGGGGVYANATASIVDSTISSNSAASQGGGVFANAAASITGSIIVSNTAFNGGGLFVYSAASISDSTIESNTAVYDGGGVYAASVVTMTGTTIGSNSAANNGGGVFAVSTAIIADSTFASNRAQGQSGGALVATSASIVNSTLTGNSGFDGAGGIQFSGGLTLTNATLVDNGSRPISGTAPFTLTDSIVAGPAGALCSQPGTLVGTNLIADTSCGASPGLVQADPLLGPRQDNGGPTLTRAPLPGSPAIGAAGACLPTDQRGFPRSAPCDVGAVETSLQITVSNGRDTVVPGTRITTTVLVTNTTNATASSAPLTVTLPPSVSGVTWTCQPGPGVTCPASGAGPVLLPVTLPPGAFARVTVVGLVDPSATGTLTVTGTLGSPPGFAGETVQASDSDLLTPASAFSVAISNATRPPNPGETLVYTVTVRNAGPSTGSSLVVARFSPEMLGLTASCTASAGSSCLGSPIAAVAGVVLTTTTTVSQTVRLLPDGTAVIVLSGIAVDDRYVAPSVIVTVTPIAGTGGTGATGRGGFVRIFTPVAVPRNTAISG